MAYENTGRFNAPTTKTRGGQPLRRPTEQELIDMARFDGVRRIQKGSMQVAAERAMADAQQQARAAQLSIEQGIQRERAIQMVREKQEQQVLEAPEVSVELTPVESGKERRQRRARFFSSPSANVTL